MERKVLITVLSLLASLSRISCDGQNLDANGNNKDYVQGVFLSVDALKDLQNRAQLNSPDQGNQPLTTFNDIRRPEQQIQADQFLKTNPSQGLQQNYNNPNGLNLIQTLGVPQQQSLQQVNQPDLIALNQHGQLVSLKPLNVAQPTLVNNQIPNNQPNLVLNNGQVPSNQVYTVVPINNPSNQGLGNGNTYLVPLQQGPPNQILTLNNGK